MIFIQIIRGVRRAEIERTEIDLSLSIVRFDKQRQSLRAADQRTRLVNRASVVYQHRAGYRLIADFPALHDFRLRGNASARFIRQ